MLALREECILVTRDYDFANPISFPPKQFYGIIVLHILLIFLKYLEFQLMNAFTSFLQFKQLKEINLSLEI